MPYKELLEEKRTREKIEPKVADISALIPEDQYLLQLNSMQSLGELLDLSQQWGGSLLRLSTVQAKDQRLQQKLEDQLCVRRDLLTQLFADAVISEMAVTGADPFVNEGTDVTLIFRVKQPEVFRTAAAGWLAQARKSRPDLTEAEVQLPRAQGGRAATRPTAWSARSSPSTRTTSSTRTRTARSAARSTRPRAPRQRCATPWTIAT